MEKEVGGNDSDVWDVIIEGPRIILKGVGEATTIKPHREYNVEDKS